MDWATQWLIVVLLFRFATFVVMDAENSAT
jgi:hypothetical protein